MVIPPARLESACGAALQEGNFPDPPQTADIPVAEIAARFGVARSTLYRTVLNPAA